MELFHDEISRSGPSLSVPWRYSVFHLISDGYELPSDGRQKVFPNGTLTISTASKSADEGYYTCTAFNRRDESDSGNAHIQVTSKNSQCGTGNGKKLSRSQAQLGQATCLAVA